MRKIPKLTRVIINRFWKKVKVDIPDKCWIWLGARYNNYDPKSYGRLVIKRERYSAHRVSMAIAGKRSNNLCVLHDPIKCNNPLCVNPIHLYFGTQTENQHDRKAAGTDNVGIRNGRSKLTGADISIIRGLTNKIQQKKICKLFGVSRIMIRNITLGRNWKHIVGSASDIEITKYLRARGIKLDKL